MDAVFSIDAIESGFDSEWILLEYPVYDRQYEVKAGKVVCHSKDRDEVYKQAAERQLPQMALLYTDRIPDDAVFAL